MIALDTDCRVIVDRRIKGCGGNRPGKRQPTGFFLSNVERGSGGGEELRWTWWRVKSGGASVSRAV